VIPESELFRSSAEREHDQTVPPLVSRAEENESTKPLAGPKAKWTKRVQ
jgi:hypothetical protein